jgi:hypothetical protein
MAMLRLTTAAQNNLLDLEALMRAEWGREAGATAAAEELVKEMRRRCVELQSIILAEGERRG